MPQGFGQLHTRYLARRRLGIIRPGANPEPMDLDFDKFCLAAQTPCVAGSYMTASSLPPVPQAPPLRPKRHIANSIAAMRRRLIVALVVALPKCPGCGSGHANCMTQ
jgi:hypothetical protein